MVIGHDDADDNNGDDVSDAVSDVDANVDENDENVDDNDVNGNVDDADDDAVDVAVKGGSSKVRWTGESGIEDSRSRSSRSSLILLLMPSWIPSIKFTRRNGGVKSIVIFSSLVSFSSLASLASPVLVMISNLDLPFSDKTNPCNNSSDIFIQYS